MDRFTTWHCENGKQRASQLKRRCVPRACLAAGDKIGSALEQVGIDKNAAPFAFASCLIQVMGKDAHNDEGDALRSKGRTIKPWGQQRWVHSQMATDGALPSDRWQKRPTGFWAWADSFDGANAVLECFGTDVSEVLDHFGNVAPGERKVFDLLTIVKALAPELLETQTREISASA